VTWILILLVVVYDRHPAMQSVEFRSEAACLEAGRAAQRMGNGRPQDVRFVCVGDR
jgi:hypothetical protein